MQGSGVNNFVVRPFGYAIDVETPGMPGTTDRETNGETPAALSWAMDANGTAYISAGAPITSTVTAVIWEAIDDDNDDGIPDSDAVLYGNLATPNYGNETNPAENDLTITHVLDTSMPGGAVPGTLSSGAFINFGGITGSDTHTMNWDEVGIIDLFATLDSGNYLGGGESISGELLNLGRFIPADFAVSMTNLIERPLFSPTASPFTYMGEEFTVEFTLTARNLAGLTTLNYFEDFAKLDEPGQLTFHAIDDIDMAADENYSSRLTVSGSNGFPADFTAGPGAWSAGVIDLSGNLIFNRQPAPTAMEYAMGQRQQEAPITPTISVTVLDADFVIDADRNVDEDDGVTEPDTFLYNLIGTQQFRYGRLRLENAYGSEIPEVAEDADDLNITGEDLPVYIFAEYYDGTEFIVNSDDVATPYSSSNLSYVPGSLTDNLTTATITVTLGNGVIYQGRTEEQNMIDMTDFPLYLTAPGEGFDGTAVMELDLDTSNLEFLQFDWRGMVELEDENADGDYTDNPRALIEFGTFLQHQRIINWQEIFAIP
jgi:hypothetical protein